jgi:phage baseplate assembly protein W
VNREGRAAAVDRGRLFGADLRLHQVGGSLDLTPDDAGDLDLAEAADNISQALTLRLLVRQGELAPLGWPDYGSRLHELIGQPNVTRTRALLMSFAQAAVEQDPRVDKVLDVRALVLGGERDVVRLELDILVITQPDPLNLVLDLSLESP